MAKYTFKQFQAEYPDDAACLAKLMDPIWGLGHKLPRLQGAPPISPDDQAAGICLPSLRPSRLPVRRDYIPQVANEPHQVVLCHVSHDQHSAWGRGQRDRAPARRHIQVRLAHVPRVAEAYGFCRLSRPAWRARASTLRLTRRLSAASHRLAASAVASTKRRWSWGWSSAEGRCAPVLFPTTALIH